MGEIFVRPKDASTRDSTLAHICGVVARTMLASTVTQFVDYGYVSSSVALRVRQQISQMSDRC